MLVVVLKTDMHCCLLCVVCIILCCYGNFIVIVENI